MFGIWASRFFAVLIVIYMLLLGGMMLADMPFPPSEPLATTLHVFLLATCVVAIPLWCSIHLAAPAEKQVFTLISLAFAIMFATVVIINRFVALTVVRQSVDLGKTDGLEWFLPYGWPSIMFAFEILGFGLFFGLAFLFLVPVFRTGRLERVMSVAFLITGIFSLGAVAGLVLNSIELIGLVAPVGWGIAPLVGICLLAVWMKRRTG